MNFRSHAASQAAWDANAAYWDEYMGAEGNDFVNVLIWPVVQRLLDVQPGQRVLDAACGNGMYARWRRRVTRSSTQPRSSTVARLFAGRRRRYRLPRARRHRRGRAALWRRHV
ncbi:MAG: hypothetical protein R2854_01540 [Caldilineaceae bacterium]